MLVVPSRREVVGAHRDSSKVLRRVVISMWHLTGLFIYSGLCCSLGCITRNIWGKLFFSWPIPMCNRGRMICLCTGKLEREINYNKVSWSEKNGSRNGVILANYRGERKTYIRFYPTIWLCGKIQSCLASVVWGALELNDQTADQTHGCQNW